jgi:hypothetical protein
VTPPNYRSDTPRATSGRWFSTAYVNITAANATSAAMVAAIKMASARSRAALMTKLQELADQDRRSLSSYIEIAFEQHVAERHKARRASK